MQCCLCESRHVKFEVRPDAFYSIEGSRIEYSCSSLTCDNCGNSMLTLEMMKTNLAAAEAAKQKEDSQVKEWLLSGNVGQSSLYMLSVLTGKNTAPPAYPQDPSDFERCMKLVRAVDGFRKKIHLLEDRHPVWELYIKHWDEMVDLYEQERPTGAAPKLYDLMKSIRSVGEATAKSAKSRSGGLYGKAD